MPRSRRNKVSPGDAASARRTILVVDDDIDTRAAIRLALEDEGYTVDSAGDGLSALQKVRGTAPDLVILDLNMPRMGGEQFLYAWRAGVEAREVPVIVITGDSAALRPVDLGVEAVLPKPFDVEKLLWHVADLLSLSARAPGAVRRHDRAAQLAAVAEDLADTMSAVMLSIERLASAEDLSDDLRTVAAGGLDAAQRAAALVRRLNHLAAERN